MRNAERGMWNSNNGLVLRGSSHERSKRNVRRRIPRSAFRIPHSSEQARLQIRIGLIPVRIPKIDFQIALTALIEDDAFALQHILL